MTRFIYALSIAFLFASAQSVSCSAAERETVVHVSGNGVDLLNNAIIHSKVVTSANLTQRSTETVELKGDLNGRVLYQIRTVIDFATNMLVNTGNSVYSGTVAGSDPVLLHDDQSRFDVNLTTGQDTGDVYLVDSLAGPKVRCTLHVVGTGVTADGNPMFDYKGDCTFRGERQMDERKVR